VEAEAAAIARAAGLVIKLTARPGALERGAELDAAAHNFTFAQGDDGRDDLDARFRRASLRPEWI
jgi:hypothetical protein